MAGSCISVQNLNRGQDTRVSVGISNISGGFGLVILSLHGVSPRDRWLCVLPRRLKNVNVKALC